VRGGVIREHQLVEAEPKGGAKRRIDPRDRTAREQLGEVVGGSAALDRAVGEVLCASSLTPVQPAALGRRAKGAVGPGVVLEGPPQDLERGAAGG
jgi:hypothetical protein